MFFNILPQDRLQYKQDCGWSHPVHPAQTPLDLAGLVAAVLALQLLIGSVPEPLRMLVVDDLPVNQHHTGGKKQAPAEKIPDKQHRRKHHEVAPVVDSAVDAASVFHNQMLERAVEQDADVVAQIIENGQHQQVRVVDELQQVQHAEDGVEKEPAKHDAPGFDVLILDEFIQLQLGVFLCLHVLLRLRLAQGHGQPFCGKQVEDHGDHEDQPQNMQRRDPP